jgi:hypothetical protein
MWKFILSKDYVLENYINNNLWIDEELIWFFQAILVLQKVTFSSIFSTYFLSITSKWIYIHHLRLSFSWFNYMGVDFIKWEDITSVKIWTWDITLPFEILLTNKTLKKFNAQKMWLDKVAKIDEKTINYINTKFNY